MPVLGSLLAGGSRRSKTPSRDLLGPGKVEWSSNYAGKTYHFCLKTCKEAFDADPSYYLLKPR